MDGSQYPPPQPGYAPPPAAPPPAPPPPGMQPPGPSPEPKKRTGLIIAIIVLVILLSCCCIGGGVAWWAYNQASSIEDDFVVEPDEVVTVPEDRERLDEWFATTASFPTGDFEVVEPDARQRDLAEAFLAQVYPDLELDEMVVDPGYQDEDGVWIFDWYCLRARLIDDPTVQMQFSIDVAQPGAESLDREDLTLEDGDVAIQIGDKTWALYNADAAKALDGGIADDSVRTLLAQAMADWPDGVIGWVEVYDDGTALVDMEVWETASTAETENYARATYRSDGDGDWTLIEYEYLLDQE